MKAIGTTYVWKWIFLFCLCINSTAILFATEGDNELAAHIEGKVLTADGKPAAFVSIKLVGLNRTVITDEDGVFIMHNLQAGTYTLQVSLMGYETLLQTVTVEKNKTATLQLQLKISDNQLQAVTVSAGRNGYNNNKMSSTLRLNEPVLQAPQNIQVISSKVLADQQAVSMSDNVIRNVSGATRLEHWGDLYTRINARGSQLSAFRNGMNVVLSSWSPLTEDMSVVDHIEFVKGPSGFLMSVGDPAGVYNIVTKKPTGITKGEADVMLGSFDQYRASVDFDGKFDKEGKLLYRLNVAGQTKNSFRAYEYNNRYVIAPVLTYKLDDKTTLTAEYLLNKVKMSDVGSYYVFSTKGYSVLPRNFTTLDPGIEPTYITDQSITLNMEHRFDANWKLTAQAGYLDYKQQGTSLWPSYVGADSMIRNVGIWDAASTGKLGQAFVNGDAQTGKVHHRILAGLDVSDKQYLADWNQYHDLDTEDNKFSLNNPTYGNPANGYPVWDRTTPLAQRAGIYGTVSQSYIGVYVQDELGFFDNVLRVTVAGRYSHVSMNEYNSMSSADKVTPRIGASVSVDKFTSVYALFDQAFIPQSGLRKDHGEVKPLTGNNMEIGIKHEFMGGKWIATLDAYRILRNNENSNDPSDPTGKYIVQLGQTKSQGVEFDLHGEIARGLTVVANYAYTNSKITKADTSSASQATIGSKVPGYAKHTANGWLNYQFTSGALKGLGFSAGVTYLQDRSTWSWADVTAKIKGLPDYTKVDAGIFWEHDKLRITCNVFNVADTYLYTGSNFGSYYYWQAEAGRNWRLSLAYRF